MKPNEVRVGNFIQDFECEPFVFEVEQITKYVGYENWIVYRKGSCKSKEVEPVNLTEYWLERFGFGQNLTKNAWWNQQDDTFIVGEENGCYYFSIFGGTSNEPTIEHIFPLQYVHQLQNAFILKTGEELKKSQRRIE
jgi:hypothetical protein